VTILSDASVAIDDRDDAYGNPRENHACIATLWTAFLRRRGVVVHEVLHSRDVAMMMVLVKVARDAHHPKRDNLVDLAGYAVVAGMCTPEEVKQTMSDCCTVEVTSREPEWGL